MATGSSLDALNPEFWTAQMQVNLEKSLVCLEVCSTELRDQLKVGDVINKPYIGNVGTAAYVPGTDFEVTGISATQDGVTADVKKIAAFYVDDVWELQSNYSFAQTLAADASYQLRDEIDQLALAYGSALGVSALGYSGAGATAFITTSTTANVTAIPATTAGGSGSIEKVFTQARRWLREGNVEEAGDWIAVVEPAVAVKIEELTMEKGFNIADATLRNGYAGNFFGFHVYISNNLPADKAIIGKRGAIDLVIQKAPTMEIKDEPKKLGKNFVAWTVYGANILTKNKLRTLNVMITG